MHSVLSRDLARPSSQHSPVRLRIPNLAKDDVTKCQCQRELSVRQAMDKPLGSSLAKLQRPLSNLHPATEAHSHRADRQADERVGRSPNEF